MNYSIYFNRIPDELNRLLVYSKPSSVFVLVDENTKEYCLPVFEYWIDQEYCLIEIQSGEINKTVQTTIYIIEQLLLHKADRNAIIINLGGETASVYNFAKKYNKQITGISAKKKLKNKIPLNHSMNLSKLNKILK